MDTSELSEQIKVHLEAGEFAGAHHDLVSAWNETTEFGKVLCDIPELSGVWVKFKTSGYPFGLRRQWAELRDNDLILEIIMEHVDDWNIADIHGVPIVLPSEPERKADLLGNVEDGLVVWLINAFTKFWRVTLLEPRKN